MGRLTAIVLGSAAGGGFPQWNCRCPVCQLAWAGDPRARPRTQASLAVSANREVWVLVNASPDLPVQLRRAAAVTASMLDRMACADAVLFDGTLFRDDEMITSCTGNKTGRRMGHISIDGENGSLAALAKLRARRIYIHINNTNPILVEGSPERARVTTQGREVAGDGQESVL